MKTYNHSSGSRLLFTVPVMCTDSSAESCSFILVTLSPYFDVCLCHPFPKVNSSDPPSLLCVTMDAMYADSYNPALMQVEK